MCLPLLIYSGSTHKLQISGIIQTIRDRLLIIKFGSHQMVCICILLNRWKWEVLHGDFF